MANGVFVHLVAIAFATMVTQAEEPSRLSHVGVAVDAPTEKVLSNVTATAYGANNPKDNGLCPRYDNFLDSEMTQKDGTFMLRIPSSNPSYVVTYCNPRYVTFTRVANANAVNGTPIDPTPVRLFPRVSQSSTQMFDAIRLLRADAQAATIALKMTDVETFTASLRALPDPERKLFAGWADATVTILPKRGQLSTVSQIASNFSSTIAYLSAANPTFFRREVQQFRDVSNYTDETILPPVADFVISLTAPIDGATVHDSRTVVKGNIARRGPAGDFDVERSLKSRHLTVIALVRDRLTGVWWVQPSLILSKEGFFHGMLYLGDEAHGAGRSFDVAVIAAPPEVGAEMETLRLLPNNYPVATIRVSRSSSDH
jgi:hypothetical protein